MTNTLIFEAAAFIVLLLVSAAVRAGFRHQLYAHTSAGGIVMAVGIFAVAALPRLPLYSPTLARLLALETLVLWLFIAASYLAAATNRHFRMHVLHPLRRFAIGTWVAGTAVLAVVVHQSLPELIWVADVLTLFSLALYLPYALLFLWGYAQMLLHPHSQNANGVVLLATVSTQSVLLALHANLPSLLPQGLITTIMALDVCLLALGLILIARHFHALRSWSLAIEWKNANCIIHGAISITGLALVQVAHAPIGLQLATWTAAAVLFVVVEFLEVIRMLEREYLRGLRLGLLVYDSSQWTRNFTYGMFYAFSLALDNQPGVINASGLHASILHWVASWGQYLVLAFLLLEIGLFLRARLPHFSRRHPLRFAGGNR